MLRNNEFNTSEIKNRRKKCAELSLKLLIYTHLKFTFKSTKNSSGPKSLTKAKNLQVNPRSLRPAWRRVRLRPLNEPAGKNGPFYKNYAFISCNSHEKRLSTN